MASPDTEQPEFLTLVSFDGFEFKLSRRAACHSTHIKRMIDPKNNFQEAKTNRCKFENFNGVVLEKVCEYLMFYDKYRESRDVEDMEVPPELSLELLIAADYLDL